MKHIVIILADDLGFGDVGYHGSPFPTPTIDALAIAGTRFVSLYAQPICTPTRAALMTGRHPYKYGLQSIVWPWNDRGLPQDLVTIPEKLSEHGYDTHMVGKWNLGHSRESMLPHKRGFKSFLGNYTGCVDYYDHTYYNVHDLHRDGTPIYPKGHTTDIFGKQACEVIADHDTNRPLFLYVAFNAPHLPLRPKSSYVKRFSHIKNETRRNFIALVAHMDDWIGEIVKVLAAKHMIDDTLLYFSSDNGGWIGYGGYNGALKDGKISFHEGGVRVPAFIHYPPWNKGKSIFSPAHVVDIFPTLLSFAGIPNTLESQFDGIDLTGALKHNEPLPDRDLVLCVYDSPTGKIGAMRSGDWKYMQSPSLEPPAIYNVAEDPTEKSPVQNQALIDALTPRFVAHAQHHVRDQLGIWTPPDGPPKDYKFPKAWGPQDNYVQALSTTQRFPATFKEALGYPQDWKPKTVVVK